MDEDGQGVAIGTVAGCHDKNGPGLIGGVAGGEVCNAAARVTVPCAGAEFAGGGDDVGDCHVGLAVGVEDTVGVGGNGDGGAFAVRGRRSADLADLRKVHGDAEDLRRQSNRGRLTDDWAGAAFAIRDGAFLSAARDGDTERNREKKQEN